MNSLLVENSFSDWLIGIAGSVEAISKNEIGMDVTQLTSDQFRAIAGYSSSNCVDGVFPDRCDHLDRVFEFYNKTKWTLPSSTASEITP